MSISDSWTPFDIDQPGSTPQPRPAPDQHVVAFLAAPAARAAGWTRRAAVELCRAWADDGLRVVLCDLGLEEPELHEVVGLYNHEGVTDALLFGSSFQRIGQHLSDGLLLATAGTAVPDGEALRAHPRWREFAQAFSEAGAVLVLYLPSGAPGAEALLELCDTAVVLGGVDEVDTVPLPGSLMPLGAIGPRDSGDRASLPGNLQGDDDFVAPWETEDEPAAPTGEPPGVEGQDIFALELETVSPAEEEDGDGEEDVEEDPEEDMFRAPGVPLPVEPSAGAPPPRERLREPVRRDRPRGSGMGRTILFLLLAVVLLVVLLGLAGIIRIPGLGLQSADAGPAGEGDVAGAVTSAAAAPEASTGTESVAESGAGSPVAPTAAVNEAPLAAWVLSVGSYRRFGDARTRASELNAALSGVHFIVAPVEVDGLDWYRVLAGSAPDRTELDALRTRIAGALGGTEGWLVRQAGLAYLLDETPDLSAARDRVADLAGRGIPAHVLRLPAEGGGTVYRVYAGAFANQDEARYMASLLRDLDPALRDASLTERRGIRPE